MVVVSNNSRPARLRSGAYEQILNISYPIKVRDMSYPLYKQVTNLEEGA